MNPSPRKTAPLLAAALAAVSLGAAAAETLPLKAVNKAGEVIDAAIEAYGGPEAIAGLQRVARTNHFVTWATGQSRAPGPPFDQSTSKAVTAVDLENRWFFGHQAGTGGGFDFNNATLIDGERSLQADFRAGTLTPLAEPDFDTTAGPFVRVTAPLLVKQLAERRQTSHWLGEVDIDGRPHDVITLVMQVGPALSLYIDRESGLLTRSERVLPPFGQVEYRFKDYEKVAGIPFANTFELYVNDQPNLKITRVETEVNGDVRRYARVPEGLARTEPLGPDEMSLNEVSEGVFLVGGNGTYGLFVEMDDHVVAVGGTQGAEARIAELRRVMPDKPIRYAVMTHHHNDHVPGAAAFAAEGATILAHAQHAAVVEAAAGEGATVKAVEGRKRLEAGRVVELIDIGPTPHVEHLLAVYLPDEKLLFEADHFPLPRNGTVAPAQPVTVALAEAIERLGLEVETIVGAHSPRVGSRADLAASLARRPAEGIAISP